MGWYDGDSFTIVWEVELGQDPTTLIDEHTRQVNRRVLGRIVFKDVSLMKLLTDIVWPEIKILINEEIKKAQISVDNSNHCVVCLIESAVLVEAQWQHGVDQVWVVDVSDTQVRIDRLCKRNNLTLEEAKDRVNYQHSTTEVLKLLEKYSQTSTHSLETIYFDTLGKTLDEIKQITQSLF